MPFPTLDGFGPTRRTLQLYSRALSAIARVHGVAHPNWWHISLRVTPSGLLGDNVPLPDGGILAGRLDLVSRQLVLWTSGGRERALPLDAKLSGTAMGERVIAAAAEAGLHGEYDRARFADDAPGVFDADAVARFFAALMTADRVLKRQRARLTGNSGPVQLWPHGFDLAMEWYGTRVERFEENGQTKEMPAQLNLGFYPGEDDASSYFYSNPWPFDGDKLLDRPLPPGASWHTEGWQGAMLPYATLRDDPRAEERLLAFAGAVYDLAAPLLR
jgi:hypothetical protein